MYNGNCIFLKIVVVSPRKRRRIAVQEKKEEAARCRCFVSNINIISLLVHHSQDKTSVSKPRLIPFKAKIADADWVWNEDGIRFYVTFEWQYLHNGSLSFCALESR